MYTHGFIETIVCDFDVLISGNKEHLGQIYILEILYKDNLFAGYGESKYFDKREDAEEFKKYIQNKNSNKDNNR